MSPDSALRPALPSQWPSLSSTIRQNIQWWLGPSPRRNEGNSPHWNGETFPCMEDYSTLILPMFQFQSQILWSISIDINPIILRRRVLLSLDNHENWKWLNRVFCPQQNDTWQNYLLQWCWGCPRAAKQFACLGSCAHVVGCCWWNKILLVTVALWEMFRHSNRRRSEQNKLPSHQRTKTPNREGHFPLKLGDSQVLCWLWGRWYPGEVLTFTPFPEHHHGTCYTYTILHAHTNRWTYVWSVYTGIYTTKTSGEQ